jgi:hypothetical protein
MEADGQGHVAPERAFPRSQSNTSLQRHESWQQKRSLPHTNRLNICTSRAGWGRVSDGRVQSERLVARARTHPLSTVLNGFPPRYFWLSSCATASSRPCSDRQILSLQAVRVLH